MSTDSGGEVCASPEPLASTSAPGASTSLAIIRSL